ncbi:MAG: hypothetical protein KAT34_22205, partial [Candidatus Aminicenantes bacterium]|nr:hypothetical protein [Candidatus Aminicenantes bacterium]
GGNLGLFNHYEFASRDIFGVKEGVIGDYGEFKVFILKYADRGKSLNRFKNAANYLKNSPRFKHFAFHQAACSMMDRKGKPLYMQFYNSYILILLGKEKEEAEFILLKMTGAWKK